MCGRYQFTAEESADIAKIIQEVQDKCGTKAAESIRQGEVVPGCKMPVLVAADEGPTPELMVWGFRMQKSLMVNARCETVLDKPTFAESARYRHCVIPSTGFYETDGDKRKFHFLLPGEQTLYMAGIFDVRGGSPCYCILTTEANESMREVHNRMPLVLERSQIEPWLYDLESTQTFLSLVPPLLCKKATDEQFRLW